MSLSDEERAALVAYRLEKATRTLRQAKESIPLGYWEMTANRLYYAAYYAVSALLLNSGMSVQTHNGINQMFGLHFIKTGILDKSFSSLYGRLISLRQTGDYGDIFDLEEHDVLPFVEPTERLISAIQELLAKEKKS